MRQVLFTIPIFKELFPPDGVPLSGFGAMLFLAFVVCALVWGPHRARAVGMPTDRFQDMVIWVFITGLAGARILYMIQYEHQFPDKSVLALIGAFFQIWKGGIIFYGSALGGAAGYGLFYWFILRRMNVSGWQLADAVAPLLALGLAIGRIGCYLNGCCWGQVAVAEVCPVPLGEANFPLLPAHSRDLFVRELHLQTSTGFTIAPRDQSRYDADPRSVVAAVEPGSPAAAAGLKSGDQIIGIDGGPNRFVIELLGPNDQIEKAIEWLRKSGARIDEPTTERSATASFDNHEGYSQALEGLRQQRLGVSTITSDELGVMVRDWPRGKHKLALKVKRGTEAEEISLPPFTPLTVGVYPTQIYETVSMVLLIGVLLTYYPFRHHDGELMVVCMMGYAIHRFINESLRIEPAVGLGLTLSQWGSVVIFAAAAGMEAYLWRVMPSRWAKAPPPGVGVPATDPTIKT